MPAVVVAVGLILLADFVLANPTLAVLAGTLADYLVVLAAAAGLAGAVALVARHGGDLLRHRGQTGGSVAVLVGLGAMLIVGLRPGSEGASDPAMRWLVSALLIPIGASIFALLFFFTLSAARRGLVLRGRETSLMLAATAVVLVLLLPLGGPLGAWLAGVAGWTLAVPIGAVFRGLLIGIAAVTALAAARALLGIDPVDD